MPDDTKIETPSEPVNVQSPPQPIPSILPSANSSATEPPPQNSQQPSNPSLPPIGNPPSTNFNPLPQTETTQPINLNQNTIIKKILLAIAIIVILLLIGLSASFFLAYNNYAVYQPPKAVQSTVDKLIVLSPLPKPPRVILETAISKSAGLKSADLKAEISISTQSPSSPIQSARLTITGPAEFENQPTLKDQLWEADISGEVKLEGAAFSAAASVKQVANVFYFKLNELPLGSIYQEFVPYKNKWFFIEIPVDEASKQSYDSEKFKAAIDSFIQKSKDWTEITSQTDDVYTLEINPPKGDLNDFIFSLISAYEPKDQGKLLDDLAREDLKKITEKMNGLKITAQVDKKTFYLKNATVSFDISLDDLNLPKQIGTESLMPQNQIAFNVKLTAELSNYNRQVVVVPPEGAQDIKKALETVSQSILENLEARPSAPLDESPPLPDEIDQEEQSLKNELLLLDEEVLGKKSSKGLLFNLFSGLLR